MPQLQPADLDNLLIRLSAEQISHPYGVLEDLCSAFRLGQLRDTLTEMMETCLTGESEAFQKAEKRADILYICKFIEKALEAIFLIMSRRKVDLDNLSFSQGS
ncbi:MAG TPA: hypothetical protein VF974_02810 [Patescibacteria group bacterium]